MNTRSQQDTAGGRPLTILATLAAWRRGWLGIDANVRALAFVQTPAGILAIHAAFVGALLSSLQLSLAGVALITLTLAACALLPLRRLPIIAFSGIAYVILRPFRTEDQRDFVARLRDATPELVELPVAAIQIPAAGWFLVLTGLALAAHRRWRSTLFGRRPVLGQFGVLAILLAVGLGLDEGTVEHTALWTLITIYTASFFFLAYAFADQRGKDQTPALLRLGFVRPYWGGPSIPFKGLTYLKTFDAKTPEELAATRLKALKLIVWAVILAWLHSLASRTFYEVADFPTLNEAVSLTAAGTPPSLTASWGVVAKNFVLTLLSVAAFWHALVAVIRMSGYRIPRNMARPLTARTIAEFWNRYLFYFKEVLVDFFFYPAFARWFKAHPRLRIACATFCAACIGNLLFSLIAQAHLVAEHGLVATLLRFESYAFYAFVLAAALVASQLRRRKPRPEDGFWRYEVLPRVGVIGFFCLIQIFADESGHLGLAERLGFFLHLFGA
ncbi:hypothetical protein ASE63_22140 [Bosea sp. Root381]|uniref:hypothetical protein n=1 Tax=Bosea sp. Root381 TaxID=1736524 RepID=UPI0006F5086B|nr:hypothetical protein [Bosea sp. Root381]KRE08028.1 hypothetical protein ASE63_22140 [Bosea sp. Root381]